MCSAAWGNICNGVVDIEVNWLISNTKMWMSPERIIIFSSDEKIPISELKVISWQESHLSSITESFNF